MVISVVNICYLIFYTVFSKLHNIHVLFLLCLKLVSAILCNEELLFLMFIVMKRTENGQMENEWLNVFFISLKVPSFYWFPSLRMLVSFFTSFFVDLHSYTEYTEYSTLIIVIFSLFFPVTSHCWLIWNFFVHPTAMASMFIALFPFIHTRHWHKFIFLNESHVTIYNFQFY